MAAIRYKSLTGNIFNNVDYEANGNTIHQWGSILGSPRDLCSIDIIV